MDDLLIQEKELTHLRELALRHLQTLSIHYPSIKAASTEIINLEAILNLPKGTEHFLSDVHGEFEPFLHVLKNASGVIRRKINDVFGNTIFEKEKRALATLIYYPRQKLKMLLDDVDEKDNWFRITLYRLIEVCRLTASKYTRTRVREMLPKEFAPIIEELLHEQNHNPDKQDYYQGIINTIISLEQAEEFIIAISKVIQKLAIERLHIIGDIYDRGPGADIIMDKLMKQREVDIQWGNHDIVWMGAAGGSDACIANVMRVSLRYANLDTLEEGYGINTMPLATFAMKHYGDDPCELFIPKEKQQYNEYELQLFARMHKAIMIIQLKLEGQIIKRRPQFDMLDRLLLDKIDIDKKIVTIDGVEYPLKDTHFPTIDKNNPYELSEDEKTLMSKLKASFMHNEKLQKHVRFLFSKGGIYLVHNGNLLYHGCIPMDENGEFSKVDVSGKIYSGRSFMERLERLARKGYFGDKSSDDTLYGLDIMWYLWCGKLSPLFGKKRMATFERYFIEDKSLHKEEKNPYYLYRDSEESCTKILNEFGLDPKSSHIVNGHVPVKEKRGESPIKANRKLIVIDGGFSKAYQPETGIAGYTLIYNSFGLLLASHEPFESTQKAIEEEKDIHSTIILLEKVEHRTKVRDTDEGKEILTTIHDLKMLIKFYRNGILKERESV
ncbi:fructose-1,6-bisphosphatase [bacterium]|nr:fructose-1,6-bisphosphatase [bacterium]